MTQHVAQVVSALGSVLLIVTAGCSDPSSSATNGSVVPGRTNRDGEVPAKPKGEIVPGSAGPTPVQYPGRRVADRIVDKTFDDIQFEMVKEEPFERSMLTPEIETLAGRRIRIRGYIRPTAQRRGIRRFILVRDDQECCFGPGAALFDCIVVQMEPGKTTQFSIRPVTVAGRFAIQELIGPNGKHLAIFALEAESVR